MNDFIEVYQNAFSDEYCDRIIESMDKAFECGYGVSRQLNTDIKKTSKEDTQLFASQLINSNHIFSPEEAKKFNEVFWQDCYSAYADKYGQLSQLPYHTIHGNKLQKTEIGQGYHIWHCEHADKGESDRILAYIVYLNDVEDGGETEFLYQHKRVKPKQGTVVIFPAGFTHTHRGNPPLSNTKYIMTGWVEY